MPTRLRDHAAAGRGAESRRADRVAVFSLLLVLPAVGSFVVGLLVDGVVLLYVSIGISALAAILLLVSWRSSARRRRAGARAGEGEMDEVPGWGEGELERVGWELEGDDWSEEDADADELDDDAWRPGVPDDETDDGGIDDDEELEEQAAVRRRVALSGSVRLRPLEGHAPRAPRFRVQEDDSAGLPIESYSRLTAAQVVAVLGLLDLEELEEVREYEETHAGRKTVLKKIDQLVIKPR